MRNNFFYLFCLSALFLTVSCEEVPVPPVVDPVENEIDEETLVVNEWIKDVMEELYLWEEYLPTDVDYKTEHNSSDYFYKLLYKELDHFSFITDDFKGLSNQLDGIYTSYGFEYQFYLKNDDTNENVMAIVNYVLPNTPAEEAGLHRGHMIDEVDGVKITTSNYREVFSNTTSEMVVKQFNKDTEEYELEKVVSISKVVIEENPIFMSKVIEKDDKKIGYFVYNSFVWTPEDSANMVDAFKELKEQQISELILDFRYNGGGAHLAANQLASIVAPNQTIQNEEVFTHFIYNDFITEYYNTNSPSSLTDHFNKNVPVNLDLSRVYILTTKGSASASEVVTIALDPYMEVVQIGQTSYGKYTSMWVIDDGNDGQTHNWGMLPIVAKFTNADGFTDFVNGIDPDIFVKDGRDWELGDENEWMLQAALNHISNGGTTVAMKSAANYNRLSTSLGRGGSNPILKDGMNFTRKKLN